MPLHTSMMCVSNRCIWKTDKVITNSKRVVENGIRFAIIFWIRFLFSLEWKWKKANKCKSKSKNVSKAKNQVKIQSRNENQIQKMKVKRNPFSTTFFESVIMNSSLVYTYFLPHSYWILFLSPIIICVCHFCFNP